MANWGIILWLVGLSAITFFSVAWLLDISNRQRQLQKRLEEPPIEIEGIEVSQPIGFLSDRLDQAVTLTQMLREEMEQLSERVDRNIRAIGLVRFQAFKDYGGDQSFALALVDTTGDGVVLSGIFSREGTRVYAKPLTAWSSTHSLSFEEEEAIAEAKTQIDEPDEERFLPE